MVTHCIDKISLAKDIEAKFVTKNEDGYTVKKSRNSQSYDLQFGNASKIPSCQCFEWKRTKLPSKHFFAVIEAGLESWNAFSEDYINSPYLTLDATVVPGMPLANVIEEDNAVKENPSFNTQEIGESNFEIPMRTYPKKSKSSSCRELLSEIKSLTFVVYDSDAIEALEDELNNIKERLQEFVPKDEGLIIENKKEATKIHVKEQNRFFSLPKPKSKKSVASGRVGIGAKRKREASKINVNTGTKLMQVIEEEIITMNMDDFNVFEEEVTPIDHVSDEVVLANDHVSDEEVEIVKKVVPSSNEQCKKP